MRVAAIVTKKVSSYRGESEAWKDSDVHGSRMNHHGHVGTLEGAPVDEVRLPVSGFFGRCSQNHDLRTRSYETGDFGPKTRIICPVQ